MSNHHPVYPPNAGAAIDPTIMGRVQVQHTRCGKPTCRCASGHLHGPYYYRVWREGLKTRKVYVHAEEVEAVRAACDYNAHARELLREMRNRRRELVRILRKECRQAKALIGHINQVRAA